MSDVSLHIDITNDNICKIIREKNGIKLCKNITIISLLDLIKNTIDNKDLKNQPSIKSAMLPDNIEPYKIIQIKTFINIDACWYIILRKNVPASFFIYKDKKYKNINMPYVLFAIKLFNNRCVKLKIVSTNTDKINNGTKIYSYPFSNVDYFGTVCLGANNISQYKIDDLSNIFEIPEMFLSMPNSNHNYGHINLKVSYEELLLKLNKEQFDNNLLVASNFKDYNDFINKLE